jgi:hypothetical protein
MKRDFKGVWIPAALWLDPDSNITEKCLLVEIDSLDNDPEKGCFASNEYLGKFIGVSAGRCANMVSDLKKRGYVEQVFFDGRNRGLRVPMLHEIIKNLHKNVKAEATKTLKQPSQKREHINTVSKNNLDIGDKPATLGNETNLDAYKTAKETLITAAAARGLDLPEAKFADAYFLNQQQRGHWYALTVPTDPGEVQLWLARHIAGLKAWARREPSFRQGRGAGAKGGEGDSATVKLPKI